MWQRACMKIFLRKDIEKVGMAGEIINVQDGFARNFLLPRKLAILITDNNVAFYSQQKREVDSRKEVIVTKTSMLAEKIKSLKLILKRKMHDDGKLYGAINATEIVDSLAKHAITISKNQVKFDKSIKSKGTFEVTIKLTNRLQPKVKVSIVSE